MQRLSVLVFDIPTFKAGSRLLADYSLRCQPSFTTSPRGFEVASFSLRIAEDEQLFWYRRRLAWLRIEAHGNIVWEGQIREPVVSKGQLTITAYGQAVALTDVPYTALWSSVRYSDWQAVTRQMLSSRNDSRYSIDTTDRLYIAPNGGEGIDSSNIGSAYIKTPDRGSKQVLAITADFEHLGKTAQWTASLSRFDSTFGFLSTIWTATGTGAVASGSINLAVTACDMLMFNFYYNRAGTTLGTAIAAGTRTVTPGAMTGITVGKKLAIGGTDNEEVVVTAITGTTFTAVFQYAHGTADTVSFIWEGETDDCYLKITNVRVKTTSSTNVYPDEIIKDVINQAAAINPTWINTASTLIQSNAIEQRNALYRDMYGLDIVQELLNFGDSAGNVWECATWEDGLVAYRRRGSAGRFWFVDETPELERALDRLYNGVYATYTDAAGIERRTTTSTNAANIQAYGITRIGIVAADTDSAVVAGQIRDVYLNDSLDGGAFGDVPIRALFDVYGANYPLWACRAGDTIIMRAAPFGFTTASDKSRAFIVAATSYDANAPEQERLSVSPEARGPRLAGYEARRGLLN